MIAIEKNMWIGETNEKHIVTCIIMVANWSGSKSGHWTNSKVVESGSSFIGTITVEIGHGNDAPERHAR